MSKPASKNESLLSEATKAISSALEDFERQEAETPPAIPRERTRGKVPMDTIRKIKKQIHALS